MKNLIIRTIVLLGVFITLHYKIPSSFYDIVSVLFLFLGLVISYKEDRNDNIYNTISNYLFWLVVSIMVFLIKKEDIFNPRNIFILLLGVKLIPLIMVFIKFRKVEVPSTFLSKIWIFTIFIYLSELILNSTHGTKGLFFYFGIISSIETIIIILKSKEWKPKVNSIISLFNSKN